MRRIVLCRVAGTTEDCVCVIPPGLFRQGVSSLQGLDLADQVCHDAGCTGRSGITRVILPLGAWPRRHSSPAQRGGAILCPAI